MRGSHLSKVFTMVTLLLYLHSSGRAESVCRCVENQHCKIEVSGRQGDGQRNTITSRSADGEQWKQVGMAPTRPETQ